MPVCVLLPNVNKRSFYYVFLPLQTNATSFNYPEEKVQVNMIGLDSSDKNCYEYFTQM